MFDVGALTTSTPAAVAASTSTLSRPTPARATIFSFGAAAITSASTVVADRTRMASASATASSSLAGRGRPPSGPPPDRRGRRRSIRQVCRRSAQQAFGGHAHADRLVVRVPPQHIGGGGQERYCYGCHRGRQRPLMACPPRCSAPRGAEGAGIGGPADPRRRLAHAARSQFVGVRHDICSAIHPLALASPFFAEFDLRARGVDLVVPQISYANPLPGRPRRSGTSTWNAPAPNWATATPGGI